MLTTDALKALYELILLSRFARDSLVVDEKVPYTLFFTNVESAYDLALVIALEIAFPDAVETSAFVAKLFFTVALIAEAYVNALLAADLALLAAVFYAVPAEAFVKKVLSAYDFALVTALVIALPDAV